MKIIKCLPLVFTLILLGCNTENEKKTDAPKLESSVIEKIDSSKYLFLDYYFGMSHEQFNKTSEKLLRDGRIKKTADTSESIYYYHFSNGEDMVVCPDFKGDYKGDGDLIGVGLLCRGNIFNKPMYANEVDKWLYNLYSDKFGKPIELLGDYNYTNRGQNLAIEPFFNNFWKKSKSMKQSEENSKEFYDTKSKGTKYFSWVNSNKVINMSFEYSVKAKLSSEMNSAIEKYSRILKTTEREEESMRELSQFLEKTEANKVVIKIYYTNLKDLKTRENNKRIEDSLDKINIKKNVESILKRTKEDI